MKDDLYLCLYRCFGKEELYRLLGYKHSDKLKQHYNVRESDQFPVKYIPHLEEDIHSRINILDSKGEYIYKSNKTHVNSLTLQFKNNTYILKNDNKSLLKGRTFHTQKPMIIDYKTFRAYNGDEYTDITQEDINDMIHKSGSHEYYPYTMIFQYGMTTDESLKYTYDKLIDEGNKMYKLTNGKLNIHSLKGKPKRIGHYLLYNNTYHIETPEDIKYDEAILLESATSGGLMYKKKISKSTPYYTYDLNSAYSYAMMHMTHPIKRGTPNLITEFHPDYFLYGIYRCKIHRSNVYDIDDFFHFSDEDTYTHYDLMTAKLLGLKIDIIQDGIPNFFRYSGNQCLIHGKKLFGKPIEYLYELKKEKVSDIPKLCLNNLYGSLCETNSKKVCASQRKQVDLENVDIIKHETVTNKNGSYDFIKYVPHDKYYIHNFARSKPFILSHVRYLMIKAVLPHKEHIIRCHTDSMTSTIPLDIELGTEMGQFKLEKSGKILHIIGVNDIIYDTTLKQLYDEELELVNLLQKNRSPERREVYMKVLNKYLKLGKRTTKLYKILLDKYKKEYKK